MNNSNENAAITLLLIMDMITHWIFIARIEGHKPFNIPLLVNGVKRGYTYTTTRIANLSTGKKTSDIPVAVETAFYKTVLAHYRDAGFSFTEKYWIENHKAACGFTSDAMLRKMLSRSEDDGVTRRSNPLAENSPRVLASVIALKKKASLLPASTSPTAKRR